MDGRPGAILNAAWRIITLNCSLLSVCDEKNISRDTQWSAYGHVKRWPHVGRPSYTATQDTSIPNIFFRFQLRYSVTADGLVADRAGHLGRIPSFLRTLLTTDGLHVETSLIIILR